MKKIILILFALAAITTAKAQMKIGDNPTTINAGSALEVESTTKGFMMPRISLDSTTKWTLAGTSTAGMTVYNTNAAIASGSTIYPANGIGEYFWDGGGWVSKKGIAGAGFSQSFNGGLNIIIPMNWPMQTWVHLISQTIYVPRDGKYLVMGRAEMSLPGQIDFNYGAEARGLIAMAVDGGFVDQVNMSCMIMWPRTNTPLPTSGTLTQVIYLTKGNHLFQLRCNGTDMWNVGNMYFINPTMTLVSAAD